VPLLVIWLKMTPPMPYCAENDEVLTCKLGNVFECCGVGVHALARVVEAPSERMLL